jgi:hypothetical protein
MPIHRGNLEKMIAVLDEPVRYWLPVGGERVALNPLIGRDIRLHYEGEINCVACGRSTKKSFNQGYCYPCFQSLAQCDICIVKPEKCHYDAGTCREPEWARDHCFQPHLVYLANSSGIKVGITRGSQIPTRWIDQGAVQALPILEVANRFLSGRLEVACKEHVADRTDWRAMLKGEPDAVDLRLRRDELLAAIGGTLKDLEAESGGQVRRLPEAEPVEIHYPVQQYPAKVKSFNFDKTPEVAGRLMGIKGQYLILEGGVINIRKFGGYRVALEY